MPRPSVMPIALITGITGQDGRYLSQNLVQRGYRVHGLVRPGSDHTVEGAELHFCDVRDSDRLRSLVLELRPNEVYSLAGQTSVAASWDDPVGTLASTGTPVGVLLDAAWQLQQSGLSPRVLHASSAEIFGNAAESPQNESTRIAPVSPYGAAKALGHFLVGSYRARGLHASSVVLYNHESPLRPESFVTRKITQGVARIARGLENSLTLGTLDVRRDWGWAPDYVEAMRLAAAHEVGDDYVIGTGVSHTVGEFVQHAFAAAGIIDWQRHLRLDSGLSRPADPALQLADSTRARRVLGWKPTVGFSELVQRMVDADLALIP